MGQQNIYIASDHAGFDFKTRLITENPNLKWVDLGPHSGESVDYPDFADLVAESLLKDPDGLGVLICGSGIGMSIRANRHPHVRAALCTSEEMAELTKKHNNANVLCLGARIVSTNENLKIFHSFLNSVFNHEERHQRRVNKLEKPVKV